MTEAQRIWSGARKRLAAAVTSAGFPEELADLLAKELKSPKAIDRLASWMYLARPGSLETIVDEMLAIRTGIEAWAERKESQAAQTGITDWLNSRERLKPDENGEEEYNL